MAVEGFLFIVMFGWYLLSYAIIATTVETGGVPQRTHLALERPLNLP